MTNYNLLLIFGFGATLFNSLRVFAVLDQEFSDNESIIKDPLVYAANSEITFKKFKDDSWTGFEALWSAIRFRNFYKRFTPLISPREAKVCMVILVAVSIIIVLIAQISFPAQAQKINGIMGSIAAMANALWFLIIENARNLKKSVDKLRI